MFDFLSPSDPSVVITCAESTHCTVVHSILSSLLIFFVLLTGFAYTTVLERRLIAWIQDRIGPNRFGPLGLLQPVADGLKLIFKQDVTPINADKVVYWLAPVIKVVPTLIVLVVVPLGPPVTIPWIDGQWYRINQGLIDPNVGVLWILAITSISVYGVAMAGWASSNKYSMLGSLRSSASMISYELALAASFAVPVMLAGSLSVGEIIENQSGNLIFNWHIFQNPVAAIIMFVALLAEVNRAPFDLPEAEQELVAGHMTEYSGMKFAMFFMAEYISMIGISVIFSSMYLGGYHFILVDRVPILGPLVLSVKVILLLSFMVWLRSALPRIRYDRLMSLGWKILLPLSLFCVAWTGVTVVLYELYESPLINAVAAGVMFALLLGAGYLLSRDAQPESATAESITAAEDVVFAGQRPTVSSIFIQVLGSLVSVPFLLFDYGVKTLKNFNDGLKGQPSEPEQSESDAKQLSART